MLSMKTPHPHSALIDRLGGTMEVARMFDIKSPSVSEWRRTGIPNSRMMFLRLARPDLFSGVEPKGAAHA